MGMKSLPLETFLDILRMTDGITVGKCRRVCHYWKDCIDNTDLIWQEFCEKDYKCSSKIARMKAGNDCKWYHIYKNMKMWLTISKSEISVREFYKFNLKDNGHALDIDSSVLALKDSQGIVLYDMSTLKYIPVALPERNCFKIVNNEHVTVLLLKSSLMIQRSVEKNTHISQATYKADNFVVHKDVLYYFNNRDVYKCNLLQENLMTESVLHCDYDIKEIQYYNDKLFIFTDCGNIVTVNKQQEVTVKPINIPKEWIRQMRYINAIDDKNFVCYSRNLFKIESDMYQHLYLDFPPISALFFYGDIVLIGSKIGDILLYRLSSQVSAEKPIFEHLAKLPVGSFAVQLDVYEHKRGPVIVASTFFEIFLLETNCFPHEPFPKSCFPANKMAMYKRLLKIRNRLAKH